MPIYEFQCQKCGLVAEVIQSYSAAAPQCETGCLDEMRRLVSRSNWQYGEGPKESHISRAIGRVKKAEREGRA